MSYHPDDLQNAAAGGELSVAAPEVGTLQATVRLSDGSGAVLDLPFTMPVLSVGASYTDDSLILIGGRPINLANIGNDVQSSDDGKVWNYVRRELPSSERIFHQGAWFRNTLWLIGGYDGLDY